MPDTLQQQSLTPTSSTTVRYADTEYNFKVILANPENRFFVFRPEAIKLLVIEDNIQNYFRQGYIVIDNNSDLLERPASKNLPIHYLFRGDSRDALIIDITPKLSVRSISQSESEKIKHLFSLNYNFVVYNVEEIPGDEPGTKFKKLYFWDMYREYFVEKNIQFSTAKLTTSPSREVKTGRAIRALIEATLPKSEGFDIQFSPSFDEGGTDIFFTAPAQYKAQDCLDYLLERHVSTSKNNYDKCILQLERYPRQWSFMSLKTIFDNAYNKGVGTQDMGGLLFLEKFLLGGITDDDQTKLNTTIHRSPVIAPYFGNIGTIDNFCLLPPAGMFTQQDVTSYVVHSYNNTDKTFNIDSVDNDFTRMQQVYNENYVKNLKGDGGAPSSNLIGNYIRSLRKNVRHVYSTTEKSPQQRLGVGRSNALMQAILLNNAITFRVNGGSYRQTGRFISIDRTDSIVDSKFDDKLLGIYLIVQVKHIFTNNEYKNDLICIKTYNYKDNKFTGKYL